MRRASSSPNRFISSSQQAGFGGGLFWKYTPPSAPPSCSSDAEVEEYCLLNVEVDRKLLLDLKVKFHLDFFRFSTVVKAVDQPFATRTLTQFILPIVSHYLASEKYHNKNTIVDSAIAVSANFDSERQNNLDLRQFFQQKLDWYLTHLWTSSSVFLQALGAVCLYLPWYQYQTVLLYYLGRLQAGVEYQRQIVRILVEILNAFHFDLSKGDLTVLNELRGVLPDDENGEIDDEKRQEEVKKEENPAVTDESTAEDIGTCNTVHFAW